MNTVNAHRHPAVAGMFYPDDTDTLSEKVRELLNDAASRTEKILPGNLKALIVPHAGYVYSGAVAASAYAQLIPLHHRIRRVVLLGPTHRVAVRGLVLPEAAAFDTPIGSIPIDRGLENLALQLPQVTQNANAHALEHSLEVQLPFLQKALDNFTLLPLAVGLASNEEVAEVLDMLWGGPETLILISSDLSHFHPYTEAQHLDQHTAQQILSLQPLTNHEQACGATPVNGLLLCAKRRGMHTELLDLRNSGDSTAGAHDKSRVVGYGAFAFTEEQEGHHDK